MASGDRRNTCFIMISSFCKFPFAGKTCQLPRIPNKYRIPVPSSCMFLLDVSFCSIYPLLKGQNRQNPRDVLRDVADEEHIWPSRPLLLNEHYSTPSRTLSDENKYSTNSQNSASHTKRILNHKFIYSLSLSLSHSLCTSQPKPHAPVSNRIVCALSTASKTICHPFMNRTEMN